MKNGFSVLMISQPSHTLLLNICRQSQLHLEKQQFMLAKTARPLHDLFTCRQHCNIMTPTASISLAFSLS